MSKARLVITAVTVEHRPVAEVAASYRLSRQWIYKLLARYRAEGDAAFEPRSRRPHRQPTSLPASTVELIIRLRHQLTDQGLDAGPHTIAWHLAEHHRLQVSVASIWRALKRAGLVTPEPRKKPKAAYVRFAAEQPNQMWQTDFERHEAFANPGGGGRPPRDACRSRRVEAGGRLTSSAWRWLVEQSSTTTSRSSTARWGGLG